ncbi:30S ribosomal protein S9 [Thermosphaera aggregans]|jgi:small subunit ribosomal protein S9|uniref:Small ribosomal subunit protein uS9 n=1 Tax=Thermosphaera aggregans (strain DSM 11486 / M11TL) TaxID=633148 RepID=D5U3F1_THEAM|nr:30S ribosomal protein S9 [Thermosphaera aggregans]ADG91651.1 SSU ribosomal protein S9P [Thermosphaera aggregans DSM 11486]
MSETVVEKYKIVVASGKRKTSIAKAVVKPGIGRVWINGIPLEIFPVELARVKMMEPLMLVGDLWRKVDIKVEVRGGGVMSQAEAARTAIARGLLEYVNNDEEVKKIFTEYDRHMLSGDPRRTESEKWGRYSARRRWQKSYR